MALFEWIPKYIRKKINDLPKQKIDASYWNGLWNLVIEQGDNNTEGIAECHGILKTSTETLDRVNKQVGEISKDLSKIPDIPNVGYANDVLFASDPANKQYRWGILEPTFEVDPYNMYIRLQSSSTLESGDREVVAKYSKVQLPQASKDSAGVLSAVDYEKLYALPDYTQLDQRYAKLNDVDRVYRYRWSVDREDQLPEAGQIIGDVYNIREQSSYGGPGTNVAWAGSETGWDSLGGMTVVEELSKAEIDEICRLY